MKTKSIYVWPCGTWSETTVGYEHIGDDFRHVEVPDEMSEEDVDEVAHMAAHGVPVDLIESMIANWIEGLK